jgi:hypothetical protein
VKIVFFLIGAIIFVVAVIVVIGFTLPKRHLVSRSASYRVPPEKLYALIAGPQDWRPDIRHWEAVPNSDGLELTRETSNHGETITYEVLDRTPPTSLKRRIATKNLPYSGTWTYSLESAGEITTIRITEDGEVYNPVFRFMSRFVLGQTRTMDAYLQSLGKATGSKAEFGN